jgi:anti-sigma factor RsiW
VKNRIHNDHVSAERLQAFLDGELPERDVSSVEEHLADCARCASELDGWRVLFDDLGTITGPDSFTPSLGFADRVMADVALPGVGDHVSTEVLHDFLDGVLAARRALPVETHIRACTTCTSEADAWLALSRRLEELGSFAPSSGFAERVMSAVEIRESTTALARLRGRIAALLGTSTPTHVPTGILQDFVDGVLPARAVARVEGHLGGCDRCTNELQSWQAVAARLETLERYAPAPGFDERVIVALRARRAARTVAAPAWARAVAVASRFVPHTRQAWAALTGVAFTPAVIMGLVAWAVFSHPTITLGSLVSFAWWQLAEVGSTALTAISALLVQGVDSFGARSLFDMVASAPLLVAGGVLVYSVFCALALRVLYRNLLTDRSRRDRFAHASFAS